MGADAPQDQGLPSRPVPWAPIPGLVQFARCAPVDGQPEPLIAMVYDSPDTRTVSYWAESAFLQLADRMRAFVAEGAAHLTVADMADLKRLQEGVVPPFDGMGK